MMDRNFYGTYYYSLIRHSGEQYCIFSGGTSITKKQETIFQTLKKFANLTPNHHPENIIYNSLISVLYITFTRLPIYISQ